METINKCLKCQVEIPIAKGKKLRKYCSKECREKHWIENNREKLNENVRKYRANRYIKEGRWREEGQKARELKAWMIELKSKPCSDCGNSFDTCCMDFDHRIGTNKKYNLGSMFAHHYSKELIQEELNKCDLVCANCHRIRTKNKHKENGLRIQGIPKNGKTQPGNYNK